MKTTFLIIGFLLLIAGSSLSVSAATKPSLEIYLVEKNNDNLQQVIPTQKPLITADDIVTYDWDKHEVVLTDQGLKKLPSVNEIGVHGKKFIVIASGVKCYIGAFWTSLSSISHSGIIINLGPYWDNRPANIIRIEHAFPSEKFAVGPDERNNTVIYEALTGLNKISPKK